MSLQHIQELIPAYAKDIKLNLSSLINNETILTKQQFWGTLIACAMASKNKTLLSAVQMNAEGLISPEALTAAKSAAALMAMNNVYYRFIHSASNPDYAKMPANLRMSMMAQPGIDKLDFELYSLAVSAINSCGFCMDSHEKLLVSKGISKEAIQTAARIAAVIHATAVVLDAENSQDFLTINSRNTGLRNF